MTTHRLPPPHGRFLDRTRTLRLAFQGESLTAHPGDTLMSALLAHGRHLAARSPVLANPRGPLTLTGLDGTVPVVTPDGPNRPADAVPAYEGLTAHAQTPDGRLTHGRGHVVGRLLDALRGGRRPVAPPLPEGHPAATPGTPVTGEVAVLGGGPAGLAAAAEAARAGARVVLVDDQPMLGGSLLTGRWGAEPGAGDSTRERLGVAVNNRSNVTVLTNARCVAWDGPGRLGVVQDGALRPVRVERVVVATGALEQPMVMRGNDLPGVMTGGAVQRAIRLWGVRPGERAVVCTVNPQGYATALDLLDVGVEVAAVLDLNEDHYDCPERRACEERGLRIMPGHTVHAARPDRSGCRLGGVVIDALADHEGDVSFATENVRCDLLAMSVGTAPQAGIPVQAGASLISDTYSGTLLVEDPPAGVHLAGALTGAHDLDHVLADGRRAGWAAARALGHGAGEEPAAPERARPLVDHPWPIFPHPKGGEIVDRDADVTLAQVRAAAEAGLGEPAVLARATGVAMGASRGRVSALHALRLAARARGLSSGGHTPPGAEAPEAPVALATLAAAHTPT